jgi:Endonuclease-reverse transcriptase
MTHNQSVRFTSIYGDSHNRENVIPVFQKVAEEEGSKVIVGDFNLRHQHWDDMAPTQEEGTPASRVCQVADSTNMDLLGDGQPTWGFGHDD